MIFDCLCIFGCSLPWRFWQVLQVMMGSKADKLMSGKGTKQIFGDLWLLQAFSTIAVVFFIKFSSFNFRFSLGGICH